MNIWYISHYAVPPGYGNSGRPHYLSKHLSRMGHKVTIILAQSHHLRLKASMEDDNFNTVVLDKVPYFHIKTRNYQGNGIGRLLNIFDFSKGIKRLTQFVNEKKLGKPDVIIYSSPQLFTYSKVYKISKILNSKILFEVRDIWPLSLIELASVSRYHPIVIYLSYIEKKALKQADQVISLLPFAYEHMGKRGLAIDKFNYIPNGVDIYEWEKTNYEIPTEHWEKIKYLKSKKKMLVMYAGSLGPPNAMDQILDLNKLDNLNEEKKYHFIIIGDGVDKNKLINRVQDEKIKYVTFLPRVKKEQINRLLQLADICFIGWHDYPIYEYGISPNKLGEYFMAEKPVLHAVNAKNDPVKEANAGISVIPYNPAALENALQEFSKTPQHELSRLGKNGKKFALEHLTWEVLGKKYNDILNNLF